MSVKKLHILLADDDLSDCLLFKEALEELPISSCLTVVHNGEQLIEELSRKGKKLPDVLFLDLNMPRKNGFAALGEIKRNSTLEKLPVVIISTSSELESVKKVFRDAAHYYICKPVDYSHLKSVIYEAIILITQKHAPLPLEENFMITGTSVTIPEKNEGNQDEIAS